MLKYEKLFDYYESRDDVLFASIEMVRRNFAKEIPPVATDILSYISHRNIHDPLGSYLRAHQHLLQLSEQFRRTGTYPARKYHEVVSIDRETYNLRLLLSYLCANHRFEILMQLRRFIQHPSNAGSELIAIGIGTGFEMKLIHEHLPDAHRWSIVGVDSSQESLAYARDLLRFFGFPDQGLCAEAFPLETTAGLPRHAGRYAKIVVCELLEHLENPDQALENLHTALHPSGTMFLTMAINLPQEDHVYHYKSLAHARKQLADHHLRPVWEFAAPATIFPFEESERESLQSGVYVCVVSR